MQSSLSHLLHLNCAFCTARVIASLPKRRRLKAGEVGPEITADEVISCATISYIQS
jgi:hypothetical protein